MLGSLILYLKGMRRMMFQLSGFYYKPDCKPLDSQRLQFSLIKEYTLNYSRIPNMIHGIFLN